MFFKISSTSQPLLTFILSWHQSIDLTNSRQIYISFQETQTSLLGPLLFPFLIPLDFFSALWILLTYQSKPFRSPKIFPIPLKLCLPMGLSAKPLKPHALFQGSVQSISFFCSEFIIKFFNFVYIDLCVGVHMLWDMCESHRKTRGVSSILQPGGLQGLNSGHKPWHLASLPTKTSCQP